MATTRRSEFMGPEYNRPARPGGPVRHPCAGFRPKSRKTPRITWKKERPRPDAADNGTRASCRVESARFRGGRETALGVTARLPAPTGRKWFNTASRAPHIRFPKGSCLMSTGLWRAKVGPKEVSKRQGVDSAALAARGGQLEDPEKRKKPMGSANLNHPQPYGVSSGSRGQGYRKGRVCRQPRQVHEPGR